MSSKVNREYIALDDSSMSPAPKIADRWQQKELRLHVSFMC